MCPGQDKAGKDRPKCASGVVFEGFFFFETYAGEEVVDDFAADEVLGHLQHRAIDQKRALELRLGDNLANGAEDLWGAWDDGRIDRLARVRVQGRIE